MVTGMVSYCASAHRGLSMAKQDSVKEEGKGSREVTAAPVTSETDPTAKNAESKERAGDAIPSGGALLLVAPPTEPTVIAPAKIELASMEAPHIAPELSELKPGVSEPSPAEQKSAEEPAADNAPAPRVNRFTMLAACLALAAAFGGMVGALGAYALIRPHAAPVIAAGKLGSQDIQALKENIVLARAELAAMKASVDAGNRTAATQFTKVVERIERMERTAAEPAAKISKAVESLERFARAEGPTAVTGSINPPQAAAAKPAGVEGWVLRDVHRGTAFLEGRAGVIEVEQGDLVPGLGRVDAIRKQDGRWVVITSKGIIAASRAIP
jgi:hypothetical protein